MSSPDESDDWMNHWTPELTHSESSHSSTILYSGEEAILSRSELHRRRKGVRVRGEGEGSGW